MSNDTRLSRNASSQRPESPDIYGSSEPIRPGPLSGPGVTGAPSSVTASNRGTRTTTDPTPTVRSPHDIITELDNIVDQFREQNISKFGAIGLIASRFNFAPSRNEPEKNRAFKQYLSTLESIEQHALEADRRGTLTAQQLDHQSDPARVSPASPQPDQYANETDARAFIKSVMSEGGNKRKRTNDDTREVGNGTGNPWVSRGLPVPIPVNTHTHVPMGYIAMGTRVSLYQWVMGTHIKICTQTIILLYYYARGSRHRCLEPHLLFPCIP